MQKYFVDTWFFIAYLDVRDSHHGQAQRLRRLIAARRLVTHDAVLTELLAYFAEENARTRTAAVQTVRAAIASLEVVPGDRALFIDALALYEARPDKEYSLVDCMSMTVMKQRGITHVLTNDHHFAQEGFVVLSDAP